MRLLSNALSSKPLPHQIIDSVKDYTIEVCLEEDSKILAYQLRYAAYIKEYPQLINHEELLYDEYDEKINNRIHLVWYQDKPVATVRSCIWSDFYNWQDTEATSYFKDEILQTIGKENLLESNRYAVHPDFQGRNSLFAQMLCFRIHENLVEARALYLEKEDCLITTLIR